MMAGAGEARRAELAVGEEAAAVSLSRLGSGRVGPRRLAHFVK
jgi:hypothetical protein